MSRNLLKRPMIQILNKCAGVKWHFIGHLQKNKVNKVTSVPGLYMVETVDSEKLAVAINSSWGKQSPSQPLSILLQINTSGEDNKSGVDPSEAAKFALMVHDKCPHLRLAGLMTIGALESSVSETENPDFKCLMECRATVAKALNIQEMDLELSMGMSQDFEKAIEAGSTNVRVGSTIFGTRENPPCQSGCVSTPTGPLITIQGGDSSVSGAARIIAQDPIKEMTIALAEVSLTQT